MITKTERAFLPGREDVSLTLVYRDASKGTAAGGVAADEIVEASLVVIGGPEALSLAAVWRERLRGSLAALELPTGHSPFEILLRELILKIQGKWNFPYKQEEVCHCRVVSLETVDAAIVCGAHTPQRVSEWTSASTACGTCRPDVTNMIAYRLGR